MKAVMLAGLLLLAGCKHVVPVIDVTSGTHKVWYNGNSLNYENERGFGCGSVDRSDNGWLYTARVINWNPDVGSDGFRSEWNTLEESERWVEQWCKP